MTDQKPDEPTPVEPTTDDQYEKAGAGGDEPSDTPIPGDEQ